MSEAKLATTIAPLPETKRGFGIHTYSHPKENKIIYTNGKIVVIRNLDNPSESVIFDEHKVKVNVAVFSPSGYWVASGDEEGNVIVWSYPGLKVKNTVKVGRTILDIDWDADSTRIVAAGDGAEKKAKVFQWDSGNNLGEILMHNLPILAVSYRKQRPFRIVTASEDLCVNFYEGPPFKFSHSLKDQHERYPNCVRFSPDGNYFASVGADAKVFLYDGKTGAKLRELEGKDQAHKGSIYSFAWSPDNKFLLTSSADKTSKIWDVEEGKVVQTFTFGNDLTDMQVSALWTAKDTLVTVSLSGAINILNKDDPKTPKLVIVGHQSTISAWALDKKNGIVYTSGLSGEICRWFVNENFRAEWIKGKNLGLVTPALTLSADGSSLSAYTFDNNVRTHSTEEKSFQMNTRAFELGGQPVAAAASPKDNGLSVCVLRDGKVVVLRSGSPASTLNVDYEPTALTFSTDGTRVFVGTKNNKIFVYRLSNDSLNQEKILSGHDKPLTALHASPDGKLLVATDREQSVYVRPTDTLEIANKSGWRVHQALINDAAFAPSSSRLATCSNDTHIIIWRDLKEFLSTERTKIDRAHPWGCEKLTWWTENTLITLGADRLLRVWTV